jgi:hypothetical protein
MTNDTFDTTCLRHPDTLSNLACGRCGDLICPQCMVQSPVGARCPECANIGQAPIFRATSFELATTVVLSLVSSAVFGVIFAAAAWLMWKLGLSFNIGTVLIAMIVGLSGAPIGDFVRRAGKYKLDRRLRIVAAVAVFMAWIFAQVFAGVFGVGSGIFVNIVSYLGLGVGVYIAMNRVRP